MPTYADTALDDNGRALAHAPVTVVLVEREQVPPTDGGVGLPAVHRAVWRGRTGPDGSWRADLPVNPKTFDKTYVVTVAAGAGRELVDEFRGPRSGERITAGDVIQIVDRLTRPRPRRRTPLNPRGGAEAPPTSVSAEERPPSSQPEAPS